MSPSEPPLTEMAPPAPSEPLVVKVARARDAQEAWGHTPFAERVGCLTRAAKEMLERRAEAMALVEEEIGKVHAEALFNEALGPLDAVKGWAAVLGRALAHRRVPLNPLGFPGKRAWGDAVPRGVVAVIAPGNFPIAGLYRGVFPALLSGNAIVLKPSEHSPRSSGWLVARLAAHLPPGVVQVAPGDGAVGAALLDAR